MRILITRHALAAAKLAKTLEADGFATEREPLLEIHFDFKPVPIDGVQAFIVTSSSGATALAQGTQDREMPTFAVGGATAAVLENEGFRNIRTGGGSVETLIDPIVAGLSADAGDLVHISGKHVAGDLAAALTAKGFSVRREILYRAETPSALSAATIKSLTSHNIDVVLFFSPRTAETFAKLATEAGLAEKFETVSAVCLSKAVAEPILELGWQRIEIAEQPDQTALIETLWKLRVEQSRSPVTEKDQPESTKQTTPSLGASSKSAPVEKSTSAGTTVIVKNGAPWKFVSILFLFLVLAVAYIAWPLWAPTLPNFVRSLLAPVMEAGRTAAVTGRVDALTKRMTAVEKELASVRAELAKKKDVVTATAFSASNDEIKKINAGQKVLASDVKSLSSKYADLDKKIVALTSLPTGSDATKAIEALQSNSRSKISSLEKENTVLQAMIKDLGGRIAALEVQPRNITGPGKSNALLLAVGQLRDTARTANEFAAPYAAVEALAGGSVAHKSALATLKKHAAKGVPDLPILQRRFDRLSGDIVRASYTPAGDGWIDQTLFKISKLVTFRRTGEAGARKDDIAGLVARVELRLAAGDLKTATEIVQKFTGGPQKVSQDWLRAAKARLAVDVAMTQLFQNALQGVGVSKTSGG